LHFGQPAARFDGLSFLLHRRLLIGPAKFQLFEQAAFGQLVLEDLQGLFDVIVKYSDFQFSPLPSLVYFFTVQAIAKASKFPLPLWERVRVRGIISIISMGF
jgi:hypothetical protein